MGCLSLADKGQMATHKSTCFDQAMKFCHATMLSTSLLTFFSGRVGFSDFLVVLHSHA
jgi:hypothetical protein